MSNLRPIPWTTVVVFAVSLAAIITLVVTGHGNSELVGVLGALLPGLLSTSYFAEKTVKQTSNGHVKDSVKAAITELSAKAPENLKESDGNPSGT